MPLPPLPGEDLKHVLAHTRELYADLCGLTLHRGDVRNFGPPAGDFCAIVHGATEFSQRGHAGEHRHVFDTIVDGTRRTLGLTHSGATSRYLLLGTGAVYGRQPPDVPHLTEDHVGLETSIRRTWRWYQAQGIPETTTRIA